MVPRCCLRCDLRLTRNHSVSGTACFFCCMQATEAILDLLDPQGLAGQRDHRGQGARLEFQVLLVTLDKPDPQEGLVSLENPDDLELLEPQVRAGVKGQTQLMPK